MNRIYLFLLCFLPLFALGQTKDPGLQKLEMQLDNLEVEIANLKLKIEDKKLELLRKDIKKLALPKLESGEEVIEHAAMSLVYSEKHEQAKWVAHIITPDVIKGNYGRTNDFRQDPKIKSGSTKQEDYFLTFMKPDSTTGYDGFGYDRGHLAPSADFRWTKQGISESYFYSNMSPQAPEFNRGRWAELEGLTRNYIYNNPNTNLYVVTGPVLKDDLPVLERSVNKVTIPEFYFKVILDYSQQKGIAFLMPNKECLYPVEHYAVSIDKVEEVSGLDFFPALDDALEKTVEEQLAPKAWLSDKEKDDVQPIYPPSLPRNHFNTIQAKMLVDNGKECYVCGTVVSTKLSRKGNVFLNLDKKFPKQIFSVFIKKENIVNFSYPPHVDLYGKKVCVKGKVKSMFGVPAMTIAGESSIQFLED